MDNEKTLWGKLDKNLEGVPNKCANLDGLLEACNDVLSNMREIIRGRKDLANKKPGVGVRGMKDILSEAHLLGENVKVDGEDFGNFCRCLGAISQLPRGGFLWIGSSALSKRTQGLCKEAANKLPGKFEYLSLEKARYNIKKLLDINVKLGGGIHRTYGVPGEWGYVDKLGSSVLSMLEESLNSENSKLMQEQQVQQKPGVNNDEELKKLRERLKRLLDKNFDLGGDISKDGGRFGTREDNWKNVDTMIDKPSLKDYSDAIDKQNEKLRKDKGEGKHEKTLKEQAIDCVLDHFDKFKNGKGSLVKVDLYGNFYLVVDEEGLSRVPYRLRFLYLELDCNEIRDKVGKPVYLLQAGSEYRINGEDWHGFKVIETILGKPAAEEAVTRYNKSKIDCDKYEKIIKVILECLSGELGMSISGFKNKKSKDVSYTCRYVINEDKFEEFIANNIAEKNYDKVKSMYTDVLKFSFNNSSYSVRLLNRSWGDNVKGKLDGFGGGKDIYKFINEYRNKAGIKD